MICLIATGSSDIIYDQFFIDYFLEFLKDLSESKCRPFRIAGTLIAMKAMTGMVYIANDLSKEIHETASQTVIEENKGNFEHKILIKLINNYGLLFILIVVFKISKCTRTAELMICFEFLSNFKGFCEFFPNDQKNFQNFLL